MLTERQIEDYLYKYAKSQDELDTYVIKTIAKRLAKLSKLASFDDLNTLEQEMETRQDLVAIKTAQDKYDKLQLERIKSDFFDLAMIYYTEQLAEYELVQFELNRELLDELQLVTLQYVSALNDLLKNPVYMLPNPATGQLAPYTLDQTYRKVLAEVAPAIALDDMMFNNAVKRAITQVFNSGMRYDTGRETPTSGNVAVRMTVLDGIKDLLHNLDKTVRKQFGGNAYELSAHLCPAPDHAPAQGHQFSEEEVEKMQNGEDFQDLNGTVYEGFVRNIGEWNCRHYFKSIKIGTPPQYTQEQLDKILADNERGITVNGKHYTMYECTQVQRGYERKIREAKEKWIISKEINDKSVMAKMRTRVGELTSQYKQFTHLTDLPLKLERIRVDGYQ